MTQEEKDLLLKDLCARLPYGVIVSIEIGDVKLNEPLSSINVTRELCTLKYSDGNWPIGMVTPYLRPMSSMTDEEESKYNIIQALAHEHWTIEDKRYTDMSKGIDWLNAHHFDYRGLIYIGLALAAHKGMYEKGGNE